MSYTSHRKAVLDESLPMPHRASHARSCALLVARKCGTTREEILSRLRSTDVDLEKPADAATLLQALDQLERWRQAADE